MNVQIQKYVYPKGSRPPLYEKGQIQEKAWPWRHGVCLLVRLPFTRLALMIGRWIDRRPSEEDDEGRWISFRVIEDWEKEAPAA